jgi:arginyl-tRNA synthetase
VIRDDIAALIARAIANAQEYGELPAFDIPPLEVTRPRDPTHGDYTSSVAMQSARSARMAPLAIARAIANRIEKADFLASIEVAPPGFINMRLDDGWIASGGKHRKHGSRYGSIQLGGGRSSQVEYISANPTGPLHIGSARNAVLGDALANVLEAAGYDVQREYYVNDAGTQLQVFAETLCRRYFQVCGVGLPE